jgi:organic radical activating enzyme
MHCPRINHFRRIMPNGTIGLCGHMINSQSFNTLYDLENSNWLHNLKNNNSWSPECIRCQQEEKLNKKSIRQHSLDRHKILSQYNSEYLIIGGVLDNICNSACQFCNENLSTKIGNLKFGKNYKIINNFNKFKELPQDRIIELDINGGEPSNSPNYQIILDNLPPNLKILRINTNASKYITNIDHILKKKIKVFITISLDGIEKIFEYARFPLKWNNFVNVVNQYNELSKKNNLLKLNFWSTLSVYTIGDLQNIINFSKQNQINLSYGILHEPDSLNIIYKNPITMAAKKILKNLDQDLYNMVASSEDNSQKLLNYILYQDKIRGTNYEDCYNWA